MVLVGLVGEQHNAEIWKTRLCSETRAELGHSWSLVFSIEEVSRVGLGHLKPAVWASFSFGGSLACE